jgi:hypothetical protein
LNQVLLLPLLLLLLLLLLQRRLHYRQCVKWCFNAMITPSEGSLVFTLDTLYAAAAAGASGTGKSQVLLGPKGQPGGLLCPLLDDVYGRFDESSCALSINVEELHNVSCFDPGRGAVGLGLEGWKHREGARGPARDC